MTGLSTAVHFVTQQGWIGFRNLFAGAPMPQKQRYDLLFILVHWLLAAAALSLLGLGWWLRSSPTTTRLHEDLATFHVSLGLSTAILIAVALLIRLFSSAPPYPEGFGSLRRFFSGLAHVFLYLSLITLVASGYFYEVFSGTPMEFWGTPLAIWGEADEEQAQNLMQLHRISAYVFAGFVALHFLLLILNGLKYPGFLGRMPLLKRRAEPAAPLSAAQLPAGAKIVQKLATRLRLFGWLQFWLQFVLAFISALLLQFATSGRIFSPLSLGFGEALYWGGVALALLVATCALAFAYTRLGKKLTLAPERFMAAPKPRLWRVNAGFALSLIGVVLAFVGVALSIVLLIAKTVSQPPGIAITDPNKIIRALDIFVLLMNFLLLLAHSLGVGAGMWLGIEAKRAQEARDELRAEAPAEAAALQAEDARAI
jgi:cytochrome b561